MIDSVVFAKRSNLILTCCLLKFNGFRLLAASLSRRVELFLDFCGVGT